MANPGAQPETATPATGGGPYIDRVIIRHFRGIVELQVELEADMTLLVGRNNVGKSRILSAIYLALGGRSPELDDFTFGSTRQPTIDVVLAPAAPANIADDDEFSTAVARIFEGAVQAPSETPLRERIAWRTTVKPSAEGAGARSESRLLTFDATKRQWVQRTDAPMLNRQQRSLLAVDLVKTGRDLMEELSRRGSSIRKILSNLEIPAAQASALEAELTGLSKRILEKSATLATIHSALDELNKAVGSVGSPALDPLPANLDELSRSVSFGFDTGLGPLPLRLHGSGSRSLASLQVQSVLYDRRLGADGSSIAPTPMTLVEEPESHLHPQAAMELVPLLQALRGQTIVSTHSAHLVTSADHRTVRLLRSRGSTMTVVDLGPADGSISATHRAFRPDLHAEEMEKLKRLVERPFGELLFATAIVLGDGATERAFLPPILRHELGNKAHGLSVIDPGSLSTELASAAVKFAHITGTPWAIFADSDDDGETAVRRLLTHGDNDATRIVWINGIDTTGNPVNGAIEGMLLSFDEAMCRRACLAIRPDLDHLPTLKLMKKLKGSSGGSLAQELIAAYPDSANWPEPIQKLVRRLEAEL